MTVYCIGLNQFFCVTYFNPVSTSLRRVGHSHLLEKIQYNTVFNMLISLYWPSAFNWKRFTIPDKGLILIMVSGRNVFIALEVKVLCQ